MSGTVPGVLLNETVIKREIVTNIVETAYTLTAADEGMWLRTLSDDPVTFTLPAQLDEDFPTFFRVTVEQAGAGSVTFAGAGGVTLNSANGLSLGAQFLVVTLKRVDVDEWTLAFLDLPPVVAEYIGFALSDEESEIETGLALAYYMVAPLTLTDARASLNVASSAGDVTLQVTVGGVLAVTLTIPEGENLSDAADIDLTALPDLARVEFTVTGAGVDAVGLKCTLVGHAP